MYKKLETMFTAKVHECRTVRHGCRP